MSSISLSQSIIWTHRESHFQKYQIWFSNIVAEKPWWASHYPQNPAQLLLMLDGVILVPLSSLPLPSNSPLSTVILDAFWLCRETKPYHSGLSVCYEQNTLSPPTHPTPAPSPQFQIWFRHQVLLEASLSSRAMWCHGAGCGFQEVWGCTLAPPQLCRWLCVLSAGWRYASHPSLLAWIA